MKIKFLKHDSFSVSSFIFHTIQKTPKRLPKDTTMSLSCLGIFNVITFRIKSKPLNTII